ncbi:phosphoribosyltransferase domain-containing protein [Nakamurella sp. GG22]
MTAGPATGSWVSDTYGIAMADRGSPVGLTMADLVAMALRQNPRRAQLLVSTVLGKHIPVDPRVVAGSGRLLGALVAQALAGEPDARGPARWWRAARASVSGADPDALLSALPAPSGSDDVLTIGFAETATSLGHLVADQLVTAYLHSTRRRSGDVPVAAEFTEPHSHATGHLLRPAAADLLTTARTVVLVDDELSTGTTALNVIEVLHGITPRNRYVMAGLVDVRSAADDDRRAAVAERLGCRIDVVSLVRGSVVVPPDAVERISADMTAGTGPAGTEPLGTEQLSQVELPWPAAVPTGGRHGFHPADRPAFDAAVSDAVAALIPAVGSAATVLVIGTEELMYLPLRIAAGLSTAERRTAFQSTTRSPVHAVDRPGYPVRRRIDFRVPVDGSPRTAERHLYNAWWPGTPAGAEADLVLLVDDRPSRPGPTGPAEAIAAATGAPVVSVVLPQSAGA